MTETKKLQKQNNTLWIIFAVVMAVVGGYFFLTGGMEHIEDANGPDNYALVAITDENIIKRDMGP